MLRMLSRLRLVAKEMTSCLTESYVQPMSLDTLQGMGCPDARGILQYAVWILL